MKKKQTRSTTGRTIINIERVYVGERKIEDVFQPINEEVTRRNIEEKIRLKKGA